MDKIIEKLLVEYLIPSILMCLCLLLLADILLGDFFNLYQLDAGLPISVFGLFILLIFSYVLNNSLSALFNYLSRFMLWGRIREYFIYRKMDVFKDKSFTKKVTCISYIIRKDSIEKIINREIAPKNDNLFNVFKTKLKCCNIPEASVSKIIDTYEVIRTLVMASNDNSIIDWIHYHWDQLRLARGTIVPAFFLLFIIPLLLIDWNMSTTEVIIGGICGFLFFMLQYFHYYYRERFMIYTMFGYFINGYKKN
jgi:hypothetical protein